MLILTFAFSVISVFIKLIYAMPVLVSCVFRTDLRFETEWKSYSITVIQSKTVIVHHLSSISVCRSELVYPVHYLLWSDLHTAGRDEPAALC